MERDLAKAPLKVGITGGIGSGKTTACRLFEALGVPVYYADERAKWLMVHDEALVSRIKGIFGPQAYTEDGQLQRAYIAERAFGDADLLEQLNAAVHPAVGRDAEAWQQQQTGHPYTLREAALLYESGSFKALDFVIVVTAPQPLRLQRVMQRDGAKAEAVQARMDKQMPEHEKAARADFLIVNDGQQLLIPQVYRIHHLLKQHYDQV